MKRNAFHILVFLLAVAGLSSCKEDDNTVEEYPDWQAKNEAYFNNLYKEAVSEAGTNPKVKVIRKWSLPETRKNPEHRVQSKHKRAEEVCHKQCGRRFRHSIAEHESRRPVADLHSLSTGLWAERQ